MSSAQTTGGPCALEFAHVDLDRGPTSVLHDVNWVVRPDERWVVLGPNGSGKTTMVQLASGYLHPTRGSVSVLGRRLGRTDVRTLRQHVALVSTGVAKMVVPRLAARDVVVSARYGALEPWWHEYTAADRERASELLEMAGFAHIADRAFGLLSDGERQQVLLARALMTEPGLLLLDEPCAGLDMGGRERLLSRLAQVAAEPDAPPVVMVTHHVEEIPSAFTHVLLLRGGRVLVSGPLEDALNSDALSSCFGLPLELTAAAGRWSSRARPEAPLSWPGAGPRAAR